MKVVSFPPNLLFPNKANPVKPHLLWDVYIVIDICTRSKYYRKHGRLGQNVCSLNYLVISASSRSGAEEAPPRLTRGCESPGEPRVRARCLRGAFCSQTLPSKRSVCDSTDCLPEESGNRGAFHFGREIFWYFAQGLGWSPAPKERL